jgi:hypothetical protein
MIMDPAKPLPRILVHGYDFLPEIDHFGLTTKIDHIDFGALRTGMAL